MSNQLKEIMSHSKGSSKSREKDIPYILREAIKKKSREVLKSRKASENFLKETGFLTRSGNISSKYTSK